MKSLRNWLLIVAVLAFIWNGWFRERHCQWHPNYKNIYACGPIGDCQLFMQRGQQFHWYFRFDLVRPRDGRDWGIQFIIGSSY